MPEISTMVVNPGPCTEEEVLLLARERAAARRGIALRFGETEPEWARELLQMVGLVDEHLRPI